MTICDFSFIDFILIKIEIYFYLPERSKSMTFIGGDDDDDFPNLVMYAPIVMSVRFSVF